MLPPAMEIRDSTLSSEAPTLLSPAARKNDGGLFETSLRGRAASYRSNTWGAVSTWQLNLTRLQWRTEGNSNYDSITDVIIHMRLYSQRRGETCLPRAASDNLKRAHCRFLRHSGTTPALFPVRQEFPNDWEKIQRQGGPYRSRLLMLHCHFTLREEHYPFWSKGYVSTNNGTTLFRPGW